MRLAVIDYGAGNLRSIYKALVKVGGNPVITSDAKEIEDSDAVVLPGVGAFGDAMQKLESIRHVLGVSGDKPFLGICLGMQVLMEGSEEAPGVKGLGLIRGKALKFSANLKIPHMGWNTISIMREDPLLKRVSASDYFYFVHSYYVKPSDSDVVLATTDYGVEFASIIRKDNIYGIQQHPEKSSRVGLKLLENFVGEARC